MITQNPITGRSRKKLAGVYARTLWGQNIIQSNPTPSTTPPTQALKDSRAAFAHITQMANMVESSLLPYIMYTAPVGRSRRHVLTSQLYTGVQRIDKVVSYNLAALTQLGTNQVSTSSGYLFTIQSKSFQLAKSLFPAATIADTSRVPCVFAISYELGLCVPLLDYTSLDGDNLVFNNISDSFIGHEVLLLCLWQVNIRTNANPIWVYGRYQAET